VLLITGTGLRNKPYLIHLFLNNQQDALIIQIYSVIKLYISGMFSAHHQEFPTAHSALVSFMQVFDDRFQAESGWNADNGQRRCPKYIEFYKRINLDN
jgi:hypothetical protein